MNANMPTIQMLGSAAGAINTASPASSAPGAQSPFSAMMGGILGQPAESTASTPTAISSDSDVSTASILSSQEFQQISQQLLAALNGQGTGEGLTALAGKLAALLSKLGNGKIVPLSAGIDLSKLAEAGVELPENLESALENGQAMLLVDEGALKALLAGGGWKEGLSVPALLMVESGNEEQPVVALVQAGLSVVESVSGQPGEKPLQFQLTFDPDTTININGGNQPATSTVNGGNQPATSTVNTQLMNFAEAMAWLQSLAAEDKAGSEEETNEAGSSHPADVLAAILGSQAASDTAATTDTVDTGELDNPEAANTALPAAQTEPDKAVGEETGKLAAKISDLISALLSASGRERSVDSAPASTAERIAAALQLLAGQVASSGDSEAAGRTLEMIEKLGRLSQLGEGEKQQVLSGLAASLRSLLAGADGEEYGIEKTINKPASAATSPAVGKPVDVPAAAIAGTEVDKPVQVESAVVSFDEAGETTAATSVKLSVKIENSQNNNTSAVQSVQTSTDSPQQILAALETVAATAGELADKLTDGRGETNSSRKQSGENLVQKIAGALHQQSTTVAQPASPNETAGQAAQPAATNGSQSAQPQTPVTSTEPAVSGSQAKVMEQPGAQELAQGSGDKAQAPQAAEEKVGQDVKTAKVDKLAAAVAVDSDTQKVSVPVSLSSLNKTRRTQSKTQAAAAVNAYSSNSGSAQRAAGDGNDLQKAMLEAGGEKAMSDLVEATVIEKKVEPIETLGRVESAESDQKAGGVQSQVGMRAEQANGRVLNFRGELQQQAGSADTAKQAEAFEKIINSARLIKAGATTELSMKLEPDHLGMMRVRMSVDDNKVMHASIQVESQEARSMIEGSLHRLRESLAEQGIKVEKFSVDVRQDQHNQSQQQSAGAGREGLWERSGQGAGHNAAESSAAAKATGQDEDSVTGMSAKTKIYGYSTLEWVA